MSLIFGDQTCRRCGANYFSENATEKMKKYNLCWHCVAEHSRERTGTLESFAEGIREVSHFKI